MPENGHWIEPIVVQVLLHCGNETIATGSHHDMGQSDFGACVTALSMLRHFSNGNRQAKLEMALQLCHGISPFLSHLGNAGQHGSSLLHCSGLFAQSC